MADTPAGLPPELAEWHRRHAEAQRQRRTFTFECRRCGGQFAIRRRGWFRAQRPSICPACHAERQRDYLRAWRARRRAESPAIHSRSCNACGAALPESRTDRLYCSAACRQKAYRARRKPA